MLKNYLKTAWRNLWKGRVFNFINITGLSVAIAASTLLLLTVYFEFSYDSFHEKLPDIYQLYFKTNRAAGVEQQGSMPIPLAPALKADYPGIENITRVGSNSILISYGDKQLTEGVNYVDEGFLRMFNFPLVQGNAKNALAGMNSIVLSQETATALFGNQPAINKMVQVKTDQGMQSFIVSGVAADVPVNSSINFDVLIRFERYPDYKSNSTEWENRNHLVLVQLKPKVQASTVEQQFNTFVNKYFKKDIDQIKKDGGHPDAQGQLITLNLAAFSNIHFNTTLGVSPGNPIQKSYIISLFFIACFILVIACINFINLSVARAYTRAREIGVRKTLGAGKQQLLTQFWVETVIVCLMALVVGLLLAAGLLPFFKANFRSNISIGMLGKPAIAFAVLLVFLLITVVAGFYPALLMLRYKTAVVLKSKINAAKPGNLRNVLLVIQFSLSALLIVCTIVTWRQVVYLQDKPLGYNKSEVISIPVGNKLNGEQALTLFRNQASNQSGIIAVTGSYTNLGRGKDGSVISSNLGFNYNGHEVRTAYQRADYDYVKTLDIHLLAGRDFSSSFVTDSNAVLINETMAASLGGPKILGAYLPMHDNQPPMQVIGIMKDFNFSSLHEKIQPMTVTMDKNFPIYYIFVRVKPNSLLASYDQISKLWTQTFPGTEFNGSWLNENTEQQYKREKRLSGIIISGASIAILIACMGLLAISIMVSLQRTKEIGMRKVLGASVFNIVLLLSGNFMKLVLIALLIAFPLAWLLMHNWLQNFAYHVTISWWMFAAAALFSVAIAFITISFQSIKAALVNPVKSLKSE